jgi:hypothetical protein
MLFGYLFNSQNGVLRIARSEFSQTAGRFTEASI